MFQGAQIEQLCKAIVAAFDDVTFEQLLLFKLDKVMGHYTAGVDGFQNQIFKILKSAELEGWTKPLVIAVALARKYKPEVTQFVQQHAPWASDAPGSDDLSRQVTHGLTQVLDRKADQGVQRVLAEYDTVLKDARDGVRRLNHYKRLHELLHKLQLKLLKQIEGAVAEARRGMQDALLDTYAESLRLDAKKGIATADELPTRELEHIWCRHLETVATLLKESLAGKPQLLDTAFTLLRHVMTTEPARINSQMMTVVKEMRLDGLERALRELCEQFQGTATQKHLQTAIEGLATIRPRLGGLVKEHLEWQIIEKAFEAPALSSEPSLTERFPNWDETHRRLRSLFELAPEEPWVVMLKGQIKALEDAGKTLDRNKFERVFDAFRREARDRFLEVDDQLLERSGSLASVAPVLDKLL